MTTAATVTLPSDTEIRIERRFAAPVTAVFTAWTTPEYVRQWWGSPEAPLDVCEIDLRVGGSWRYTMQHQGQEIGWHGTYLEVVRPRRLVSTEVFEGFPDAEAVNTWSTTGSGDGCTVVILVRHSSKANRDGHIASGMEEGMQHTMARLDAVAQRINNDDNKIGAVR